MLRIIGTQKNSIARKQKVVNGEIVAFDGNPAVDMLDVAYYESQQQYDLTVKDESGQTHTYRIDLAQDQSTGLIFDEDSYLCPKNCRNKCIFCFIDQLPRNMRKTLYVKDDDWQMSFACGNYVTLTNLSDSDVERIITKKFSPLYVSVHSTDDELRRMLLGNKNAPSIIPQLTKLADNGIVMNAQIVLCPGINDGSHLLSTLQDLYGLYPAIKSVAIVPVGLTKHRANLYALQPYNVEQACDVIDLVEQFDAKALKEKGEHFVYCSDEFYIDGDRPIPPYEFYGDFDQIENGVGLVAQLLEEFDMAFESSRGARNNSFSIITGVAAQPHIQSLVDKARLRYPTLRADVHAIVNDFFGHTVNVAGLVCGCDIIKQTADLTLNKTVLIPSVMLREFENVFLDGTTLKQLETALKRKIVVVEDGYTLCETLLKGDYV